MVPSDSVLATSYRLSIVTPCLHLQRFGRNFTMKKFKLKWLYLGNGERYGQIAYTISDEMKIIDFG